MTQSVFQECEAPEVQTGGFFCRPGVVVVQIDLPYQLTAGGIHLPKGIDEDLMPDLGTVIATGRPEQHRKWEKDGNPYCHPVPELGARVLVKPKHGKSVEGFVRPGVGRHPGFTRFYGFVGGVSPWTARGDRVPPQKVPWHESIIMEISEGEFYPTSDRVLIKHELRGRKSDGGIYIAGIHDHRKSVKAEAVRCGPLCTEVMAGMTLLYHEGACEPVDGLPDGYAVVKEEFVYGWL